MCDFCAYSETSHDSTATVHELTNGNILNNATFYGVGRNGIALSSSRICDGWDLEQRRAGSSEPGVVVDAALPTGVYVEVPQTAAAVRLVQSLDAYKLDEALSLATTLDVVEHVPGSVASVFLTAGSRDDPIRAERVHTTLVGVPPPGACARDVIDAVVRVSRPIYLMQPYKLAIALAPGACVEIRRASLCVLVPRIYNAMNLLPHGDFAQ